MSDTIEKARSNGDASTAGAGEPINIATHLRDMAARQPRTAALHLPRGRRSGGRVAYAAVTFRELNRESDRLARGLQAIGIGRGARTVLMIPPGLDFFAVTFALFKAGAVPVLIDPGMGVRRLGPCLEEARPSAFIGVPKAHAARVLLGWGRSTLRTRVTAGGRLFWGGVTLDELRAAARPGDGFEIAGTRAGEPAAILFTSGSTGPPKGAVYTHGIFQAQVDLLRSTYGIEPGEIDLPTFPLFALFDAALGMTAVIPEMDFTRPARVDPARILGPIEELGVTNLFGSPALIDTVGRHGAARGVRLPTLRRVLSAGAPVPPRALERFTQMLSPGVEIFTPYGATEALPVASIGSAEILGETARGTAEGKGVCVGRPVEGIDVAVIGISDDPIERWSEDLRVGAGETGEIVVRGPVVTRAYHERPRATALAKIIDTGGESLWHRMGDLGRIDEQGRLWFSGRKSQRVITSERTLFTIPVEGVFNAHPAVRRSALVGIGAAGAARPVLCVEREREARRADREKLTAELLQLGAAHGHTRAIDTVLYHDDFPVDIRHNAKIFREKLAAWAARRLR